MIFLENTKFAEMNHKQLAEIKQLEEKLDVILIAYNQSAANNTPTNGNNPDVINPS